MCLSAFTSLLFVYMCLRLELRWEQNSARRVAQSVGALKKSGPLLGGWLGGWVTLHSLAAGLYIIKAAGAHTHTHIHTERRENKLPPRKKLSAL
jgi:hypothetical protein